MMHCTLFTNVSERVCVCFIFRAWHCFWQKRILCWKEVFSYLDASFELHFLCVCVVQHLSVDPFLRFLIALVIFLFENFLTPLNGAAAFFLRHSSLASRVERGKQFPIVKLRIQIQKNEYAYDAGARHMYAYLYIYIYIYTNNIFWGLLKVFDGSRFTSASTSSVSHVHVFRC